jgi:hypothetical protein
LGCTFFDFGNLPSDLMGSSLVDPSFAWFLDTGCLKTRAEQPHSSLFYISFIIYMAYCCGMPNMELDNLSIMFGIALFYIDTCLRQLSKWNLYMSNMYEITMLIYEQHI